MTDDGAAGVGREGGDLSRALLVVVARSLLGVTLLVLAYFHLPLKVSRSQALDILLVVALLVSFALVFVRQLRRVREAQFPVLRAAEALTMVATLFVVIIASIHVGISANDAQAYSEVLDRLAGLYFTVTVLATVGFGDITPVSDVARVVTTIQMVLGIILLGAGVRAIAAVAQQAQQAREEADRRREDA